MTAAAHTTTTMKLTDLLARHDKAATALARLHALPAELESKRDTLLATADLDAVPSAELSEITTKLTIIPRKTEQAELELEEASKALRAGSVKEASRLCGIGRAMDTALRQSLVVALKPFIADWSTPQREALLNEIASESSQYLEISHLLNAPSGAYHSNPADDARHLIALADKVK